MIFSLQIHSFFLSTVSIVCFSEFNLTICLNSFIFQMPKSHKMSTFLLYLLYFPICCSLRVFWLWMVVVSMRSLWRQQLWIHIKSLLCMWCGLSLCLHRVKTEQIRTVRRKERQRVRTTSAESAGPAGNASSCFLWVNMVTVFSCGSMMDYFFIF